MGERIIVMQFTAVCDAWLYASKLKFLPFEGLYIKFCIHSGFRSYYQPWWLWMAVRCIPRRWPLPGLPKKTVPRKHLSWWHGVFFVQVVLITGTFSVVVLPRFTQSLFAKFIRTDIIFKKYIAFMNCKKILYFLQQFLELLCSTSAFTPNLNRSEFFMLWTISETVWILSFIAN